LPRKTNRVVLYTTLINWMPMDVKDSQGYARCKTLAKDEETGARTMLIKYEPGFKAEARVSTWPADIYVLEGEMQCGDRSYSQDTYHYRPAGTPIGPVDCPKGCTRLIFTADSKEPGKSSTEEIFIQNVGSDVAPDPPSPLVDPKHPTLRDRWRKILRVDPAAELSVRVQRVLNPGGNGWGPQGRMQFHPWVEECFLIAGVNQDYSADIDGHWRWIPGVYVCRQPYEGLHGDSLKFDGDYHMIVRSGWTDDPARAAEWNAIQDKSASTIPIAVQFEE
jgi:hypothetical protein